MPSDDTLRQFTDAQVPPCTPPVTSPFPEQTKGASNGVVESVEETKRDSETNEMSPETLLRQKTLRLEEAGSEEIDGEPLFPPDPGSTSNTPAEHETKDRETEKFDSSLKEPADTVPPKQPKQQPNMYEDGTYWKNPCCI